MSTKHSAEFVCCYQLIPSLVPLLPSHYHFYLLFSIVFMLFWLNTKYVVTLKSSCLMTWLKKESTFLSLSLYFSWEWPRYDKLIALCIYFLCKTYKKREVAQFTNLGISSPYLILSWFAMEPHCGLILSTSLDLVELLVQARERILCLMRIADRQWLPSW